MKGTITYLEKRTIPVSDTLSMDEMAEIAAAETRKRSIQHEVRMILRKA